MTIESLARTIAKARHGTDAHWANYVPSAREVVQRIYEEGFRCGHQALLERILALPDGAQ
jgi:hypothetical protein